MKGLIKLDTKEVILKVKEIELERDIEDMTMFFKRVNGSEEKQKAVEKK